MCQNLIASKLNELVKLFKLNFYYEQQQNDFLITVCELMSKGVAAIFGPSSIETSGIASSVCNALEIPHIITHWEREYIVERPFTINMYPDAEMLSQAYADLLIDYTWKSYTIIYEDDDSLRRLKDILQIHSPKNLPITVQYVPNLYIYI
jgi:glutamate receptor, ionotropic, invertebrate